MGGGPNLKARNNKKNVRNIYDNSRKWKKYVRFRKAPMNKNFGYFTHIFYKSAKMRKVGQISFPPAPSLCILASRHTTNVML